MTMQQRQMQSAPMGRAQQSGPQGIYAFIYGITGLFAATLETFSRYGMGERHYKIISALFSWCILFTLIFFSELWMSLQHRVNDIGDGFFALIINPSLWIGLVLNDLFLWVLYPAFAIYHLVSVRVQYRLGTQPHSNYWGRSWLEPLSGVFMRLINWLAALVLKAVGKAGELVGRDLLGKQRGRIESLFPVFRDADFLTKTVIEPLAFILLGWIFTALNATPLALWMWIAVPCLIVHNAMVQIASRNHKLDLADMQIEAVYDGAIVDGQRYNQAERELEAAYEAAAQAEPAPGPVQPVHFRELYPQRPNRAAALEAIAGRMRNGQPAGDGAAGSPDSP